MDQEMEDFVMSMQNSAMSLVRKVRDRRNPHAAFPRVCLSPLAP